MATIIINVSKYVILLLMVLYTLSCFTIMKQVSEEEIRMMVDVGSEKGVIDETEKEFIQNVFEFDDTDIGEFVTHRTELSVLWLEDSLEDWEKEIHETRHSLYPICDETVDKIVGVLDVKDYFRLQDNSKKSILENAVRPVEFVPESIKADVLFRKMKQSHKVPVGYRME